MGKMHAEGVTLIELMVAVAVIAMVFAVGVPAFSDFVANNRMTSATNDIVSALHLARIEAIRRDGAVELCAVDDWQSVPPDCDNNGDLRDGWMVIHRPPATAPDPTPVILSIHEPLPSGVEITGPGFLSYTANRPPADAGGNRIDFEIVLCDQRGDHDIGGGRAAGRRLLLRRPSGRPRMFDQLADVDCGS
jgi:type IV fimbrial biogenesis protein FimT